MIPGMSKEVFLSSKALTLALRPIQPPLPRVLGYKADHLPLSSAEFNNVWSYTSTGNYIYVMVNN
jgi:hypothetical protein